MSTVTFHVALPFVRDDEGHLCPDQPIECPSPAAAVSRARAAAVNRAGAIAFSRTGDPDVGEYADAVILARIGDVPSDLESVSG